MSKKIRRLEMADLRPDVAEALGPRVARLGYLGEFFKCAGHQPRSLLAFMELTDALKDALDFKLAETAVLTVAKTAGNDYELHQHERLCEKQGLDRRWIAAVERLLPDEAVELSDSERALQRLTLSVLGQYGRGAAKALDAAIEAVGPAEAIAVLMLIGRYLTHAIIVNALELKPPVPSIFDGA